MLNMYLQELKQYRKATFWWSVGMIALLVTSIAKYEGIAASGPSISELFKKLPHGLAAVLGATGVDVTSGSGYFVVLTLYLMLMLGVHAVLLGSGIVAKEESEHTAEFLYTKPKSRWQVLTAKLLAGLTLIIILNAVTVAVSIIGMDVATHGSAINRDIIWLTPALFGIQLYFAAVGFAFAAILARPKRAGQWAAGVLVATFVISSFVEITDKFGFLKYLTPFQYFNAQQIFTDRTYDPVYVTVAAVTVIGLIAAAFIRFGRRDITT